MATAMQASGIQGQWVVIGVHCSPTPFATRRRDESRATSGARDPRQAAQCDDVIANLRHAKRIMKCLARRLGNLQCHRVCADNLHHEGAVLIQTVAVIQNVLKSRIECEPDVGISVPWLTDVVDSAADREARHDDLQTVGMVHVRPKRLAALIAKPQSSARATPPEHQATRREGHPEYVSSNHSR